MNGIISGCLKQAEPTPNILEQESLPQDSAEQGEANQDKFNQDKLNQDALFCSETEDYRSPEEPEANQDVVLRFRTARDDADEVIYRECGSSFAGIMKKTSQDQWFDYYEYKLTTGTEPIYYYFEVKKGKNSWTYTRLGVSGDTIPRFAFRITPGFHTPDWAKGAVMYQIYVDRFCNGDSANDVESGEYIYIGVPVTQVKDWEKPLETMDVGYFYGGDLQGVWDKLDYIQSLGVEVIYLNPIFVSPSNHKYDCQDYEHIDPHYGVIVKDGGEVLKDLPLEDAKALREENKHASKYITRVTDRENLEASDAFFARLVEEIHRRGMKIILDGVFNHCGSFNKWLDREGIYEHAEGYEPGAYVSADSPYYSFFKFYQEDKENWPYNGSYDGWWGHDTLPKLNYEKSEMLQEYILGIAKKWLSPPYNIDGWRLDVAADLGQTGEFNHYFWQQFRKAVKSVNPDALILAEHYGDPSSWLKGNEWDSVMNYDAFMEPISWFLTGMEKHSDEYDGNLYGDGEAFFRSMEYHMSLMQTPSLMTAMNELSNHDHSRFLTRTNQTVGRLATMGAAAASEGIRYGIFRAAVMIQMTWPGAPTLYYGDEAGLCGWTDPDNRRPYPWGKENLEMIEFHRYMGGIHNRIPALKRGALKKLLAGRHLLAYGRMCGKYKAVVVVNSLEQEQEVQVPVWLLEIDDDEPLARVMLTTEDGYNVGAARVEAKNGIVSLTMPPTSSMLMITHVDEFFTSAPLREKEKNHF